MTSGAILHPQETKVDFRELKIAVAKQFERLKQHGLFRTSAEKDLLWDTYLGSFPQGTNPIFRERTEHDCNCCKQFIRAVGNMVAIVDGQIQTIWDVEVGYPYQVVADAMAALVKAKPVDNVFLHTERTVGTDKNFQQMVEGVKTLEHFFLNLPREVVVNGSALGSSLSDYRATHDVLLRSLSEIAPGAIDRAAVRAAWPGLPNRW